MTQSFLPLGYDFPEPPREARGAIFTKPWVVELLLDLAGYEAAKNLVDAIAVEPSAGEGAFLAPMARRLIASCRGQGRELEDCRGSLLAYEIDERSAESARSVVTNALRAMDVPEEAARELAASWIRRGDFLLEAFGLGGADFVVGNPPYVRLEDIPEQMMRVYRNGYPAMRGRADLYVAFFEAALRLLKPGGVCSYICADRWMFNQYGADLRGLITAGFGVEAVVEMHNAEAFAEEVSAYPAITVIRRAAQGKAIVASIGPGAKTTGVASLSNALRAPARSDVLPLAGVSAAVVEDWFTGESPWPCSSPRRLALLRQIEKHFGPLELESTGTKVGIGVATGCDGVFITKEQNLVEPSRLLPLALASDTTSGHLQWSGHYLIDPWTDGGLVELGKYPRFRAYAELHREALERRHTAKKNAAGWFRTIDRVNHALTTRPKLYIPDIKDVFNPVLDTGTTYPHHNLYVITSTQWDLEVLGGLLLSGIGRLFIESYGVRMRGGYLRFQAQYLRRIRVPRPEAIGEAEAKELARAFRERDRRLATEVACSLYAIEPAELEAALGP